ncbi:uncharacterized protein [Lolium perenne]|uniref:uncharacterized protein n=1 Tax=Lolium perenne TaxID=4522 RepID=UPI0021EAC254|nr:uncharacterized protein LOC127343488 [Lolium perenne]
MENGAETPASPTAVDKAAPNGAVAAEEVTLADPVHPAKSYAAVAANAEIDDLRATKLALEDQLAAAADENTTLAAEAHRLEGLFSQARDDVATAEHAAAATESEAAALRAEVQRLQALLDRKRADREEDQRQREQLEAEVGAVRQAKRQLQEEIDALKASAATVEEREVAPDAVVPKEDGGVAWQGVAAGAAAGAVVTAAVVLVYLRLKR